MRLLGIETSCDETAAAVVEDGRRILSNVVHTQIPTHALYGGVVPELASRMHVERILPVVQKALADSGCTPEALDGVAVTFAPGLIGPLLVGVNFAKGVCMANRLPLVPVHHLRGHIAANYLTHAPLKPPFLCLVVSGGNTQLVEVLDYTRFRVVGQTQDDAAGEAFDKAGRVLDLPYPAGAKLDALAKTGNPHAFTLPTPHMPGLDFSFSGLKTAVVNRVHNAKQSGQPFCPQDIAAVFCRQVTDILCEKTKQALQQTGHTQLAVAGGVSANSFLRAGLETLAKETGCQLYLPALDLCGDNAAMIAAQGCFELAAGNIAPQTLNALAYLPLDDQGCQFGE